MDAISALSSIAASNAIAGLTAPTPTSENQATTAASQLGAEPSTTVDFSQFVQNLLTQQANNPDLNLETAFAQNLGALALNATSSSQLYDSSGQLQQFASTALLAQLENDGVISASDRQRIEALQSQSLLNSDTDSQSVVDAANASLSAQPTNASTSPQPSATSQSAIPTAVSNTAVTPTAPPATNNAGTTTDQATVDVIATPETVASTPASPTVDDNAIPVDTTPATNGDQALTGNPDPYQQAVLASGTTSFGKELNVFVPSAIDDSIPPAVSAIAPIMAVRRVVARGEEPTESSVNATA